jgi:peptide/nickel transport system ATP-binding protein
VTPSIPNCDNSAGPLLEVDRLRIEFPTRRGVLVAVDDISFSIAEGEVLGVVGESGAGKSITGAAIIGLLEPPGRIARGTIRFQGQEINGLPYEALRRIRGAKIGAIFQDPLTSLNPLYTIGRQLVETITTHLELSPAKARARAVELLNEVGIPAAGRRIDSYPHEFSGGMRQRVVIALAVCAHPRLIIADEPTTALDVSIQAQILGLLRRLCREHRTAIMLITHDMGVIAEMSDRVGVMYAGRMVEIGSLQDVVKRPKHPYTVGLMDSIPLIGQEKEQLSHIRGAMPRLQEIPSGCPFHPRCPEEFDRCRVERPDLMTTAHPGQRASCWKFAGRSQDG